MWIPIAGYGSLQIQGDLNDATRSILSNRENEIYFSAASAWEIVIKFSLGKLGLPQPPLQYIPTRLSALGNLSLPIEQRHVLQIEQIPSHHKDPFDRILVAQAQIEGLHLVTADKTITMYDVPIIWADIEPAGS